VFALSGAFVGLLIHARFKVASFTSMVETVIAHWESVPRIPPPNGSVLASSHGWASSTRYGNIAYGEIDDLVDGLIGGKNAMIACHFPQGHIDRLNGIGGIDHFTDILWESK
jgi:hypothetical protein